MAAMAESEERLEGFTDSEDSSSEAGTMEGSDDGTDEAAPAAAGAQHNYNLRSRRVVPDAVVEHTLVKNNESAPGVGVVTDRYHVGGRDKRASCRPYGVSAGSESPDDERSETGTESGESSRSLEGQTLSEPYDGTPRYRHEIQGLTLGRRRLASSLLSSRSREQLEAQSAQLIAHMRKCTQGRKRRLSPPTNELVIRRDSSRPSDAGRNEKNRREPSASNLLGQVPEKPGRGLFSDRALHPTSGRTTIGCCNYCFFFI